MWPGEQTMKGYAEVKSETPKTIADLNALIAKAGALSGALSKAGLTLTVPQPVKSPEAGPARKTSSVR